MKIRICWLVFWVLVTSEVTRHLRDLFRNRGHCKNPRASLLLEMSSKIPLLIAYRVSPAYRDASAHRDSLACGP